MARVYAAPPAAVWAIAGEAVGAAGLDVVSVDQARGVVLAQHGPTLISYGEDVSVFIRPEGNGTRIEVVSLRAEAANVLATNWTDPIFEAFDARLG
ncbi:hypothetical protein G5B39_13180 (plasmid) [Rhodobacteraceae bacterium SC52]|nr:hypothetical protein G5B39_13180 [Rhodobacteraceae bacterium SC52]